MSDSESTLEIVSEGTYSPGYTIEKDVPLGKLVKVVPYIFGLQRIYLTQDEINVQIWLDDEKHIFRGSGWGAMGSVKFDGTYPEILVTKPVHKIKVVISGTIVCSFSASVGLIYAEKSETSSINWIIFILISIAILIFISRMLS